MTEQDKRLISIDIDLLRQRLRRLADQVWLTGNHPPNASVEKRDSAFNVLVEWCIGDLREGGAVR